MTAPSADIVYRPATPADLPGIAEVFVAAFPESVAHVAGALSSPRVMAEVFAVALDAEPRSLRVATDAGRIAGYCLAPAQVSRLRGAMIWRGHWLRLAWGLLSGRYGLRLGALRVVVGDKLSFLRHARQFGATPARILSLGVHPDFQGRGLGKGLLEGALAYLDAQRVGAVRLEVRPDNGPAVHLYERYGFAPVGAYNDSQGPWLVMVRQP